MAGGLEAAWRLCSDIFCRAVLQSMPLNRASIERELLFCLLGGFSITYEHALSATRAIEPLHPFAPHWDDAELLDVLIGSLLLEQFLPLRRDGSLRRYRFPGRKARTIVAARRWLLENEPIEEVLQSLENSQRRRDFLCECPGVGLKTASWLLRNLGLGDELAVVDVHLVRVLLQNARIPASHRLPRDYPAVEEAFLGWCRELGAPPPAFDLFLWEWDRAKVEGR